MRAIVLLNLMLCVVLGGCPIAGDVPVELGLDTTVDTDVATNVFNIEVGDNSNVSIGNVTADTGAVAGDVDDTLADDEEGHPSEGYDLYFAFEWDEIVPMQLWVMDSDGTPYPRDGESGKVAFGFRQGYCEDESLYQFQLSAGYPFEDEIGYTEVTVSIYMNGALLTEDTVSIRDGGMYRDFVEYQEN